MKTGGAIDQKANMAWKSIVHQLRLTGFKESIKSLQTQEWARMNATAGLGQLTNHGKAWILAHCDASRPVPQELSVEKKGSYCPGLNDKLFVNPFQDIQFQNPYSKDYWQF